MLDARISSTDRIAAFWGIAPAAKAGEERVEAEAPKAAKGSALALPTLQPQPQARTRPRTRRMAAPVSSIQKTIEDALRAAGLLGR
jgi:hypothetical protein